MIRASPTMTHLVKQKLFPLQHLQMISKISLSGLLEDAVLGMPNKFICVFFFVFWGFFGGEGWQRLWHVEVPGPNLPWQRPKLLQ